MHAAACCWVFIVYPGNATEAHTLQALMLHADSYAGLRENDPCFALFSRDIDSRPHRKLTFCVHQAGAHVAGPRRLPCRVRRRRHAPV